MHSIHCVPMYSNEQKWSRIPTAFLSVFVQIKKKSRIQIRVKEINITYLCFSHTIVRMYNDSTPWDTTSNGI